MSPTNDLTEIESHHQIAIEAGLLYWNNDFEGGRQKLSSIIETPRGMLEESCLSLAEDMLKGSDKKKLVEKFQAAGASAEKCLETKTSFYKKISKILKSNQTPVSIQSLEFHLIVADCLLDASLGQLQSGSYLSGTLGLRKAFSSYTQLRNTSIQFEKNNQKSPRFITDGYKFGLGAFYLCLSVLPHSAILMLKIAGIHIDPVKGNQYLTSVVKGRGVRYPVAAIILLGFYLCSPSGFEAPSMIEAKEILSAVEKDFPENKNFMIFDAYYHRKRGDFNEALSIVSKTITGSADDNIPLFVKAELLFVLLRFHECISTIESLLSSGHVNSSFAHYEQILFMLSASYYATGDVLKGDSVLETVSPDSVYRKAMQSKSGGFSRTGMFLAPILYSILNRDFNHLNPEGVSNMLTFINKQLIRIGTGDDYCSCLSALAKAMLASDRDSMVPVLSFKKQFPTLSAAAAYEISSRDYQNGNFTSSKSYLQTASKIDFKFDSLSKRISVAMDQVSEKL